MLLSYTFVSPHVIYTYLQLVLTKDSVWEVILNRYKRGTVENRIKILFQFNFFTYFARWLFLLEEIDFTWHAAFIID